MKAVFIATCLAVSSALTFSAQAQSMATPNTTALRCVDFQKSADGAWTAQRATQVPYPNGLVTVAASTRIPGGVETYMGLRLGQMLDEQCGAGGRR